MGIVEKDPNDEIKNFKCTRCGEKFILPFSQSDPLQIPSRPPPRRKNGPV